MGSYKFLLAIFLLLAILGIVFAAKDLNRDTDGDGLKDHVDDYDDDNDNIPDIHDEDDDGDGLLDTEVSQTLVFWRLSWIHRTTYIKMMSGQNLSMTINGT